MGKEITRYVTASRPRLQSELCLSARIDGVDAAWDEIAANASLFIRRPYLAALERTSPDSLEHRYAVVKHAGKPVAIASVQLLAISGDELVRSAGPAREDGRPGMASRARDMLLRLLGGRVAICGNFFSTGPHGFAFARDANPVETWSAVIEAVERIRRAEPRGRRPAWIIIKDIPSSDAASSDFLRTNGFIRVETEPDMVIENAGQWRDYAGYLDALKAKYRKAALQVIDTIAGAGCIVENFRDISGSSRRLHALYRQVERRGHGRFASLEEGYFTALAHAVPPDEFRCNVVRDERDILGFVIVLKDGASAMVHYAGFDYEANARLPVYFRLLHAAIENAADWGCSRISFARTALEPKARLGARPATIASWVRHRNPVINRLGAQLAKRVHHDQPPDRRPFKRDR